MWPFSNPNSYLTIVDAKRAERTRALAAVSSITTAETNQEVFLRATASEIVSRIEKGEWTASQVVDAFIVRAASAQAATNCLTEVLFDQARRQAKELDDEFAVTKKLRGPLHGVPVSFKELFDIAGVDTTLGFSQWAHKPALTDADLVTQFRDAGAVIIAKTNIPQTMLAFECRNPVWGRSTNPYNDKYTCGGSSGGEGALLAMDGSVIGIGSDVGGSLRIPAAYCGIYSLKPGKGRTSGGGTRNAVPGFEAIPAVIGPMARSIDDLQLACRMVFGVQGSRLDISPVPYRDVKLAKKLRFGYYTSDNYAKASPACKRAVLETVEALQREGHECVEFDVPYAGDALNTFIGFTSSDGYKTMLSQLGPDPKEDALFLVTLGPRIPWIVRSIGTWLMENWVGDKIFAQTMRSTAVKPVEEYMKLAVRRDEITRNFNKNVWEKYGFDGIIAPVQALPQLRHGGCDRHSVLAVASILYNVVDSPVGCLPVTHVDPSKDQVTEEWTTGPGLGSLTLENALYRGKDPLYDAEAMKGMPIGIQVVGRKWEEEKVLAMMKVVDGALGKGRGFGPGSWGEDNDVKI